jgi:hypothetical protein
VAGIDRNIPGMPHNAAPLMTARIEMNAFNFTFDPMILGTI